MTTQEQPPWAAEAASYTNLILIGGYAAFFTMWSSVKEDLSRGYMLWAALLMTVSVSLFLLFEVLKMVELAGRLQRSAQPGQVGRLGSMLIRSWNVVLWITALTGFGGATILGVAFVDGLLDWYSR